MSADLVEPCASCARHVRASEERCPFCGAPHVSVPRPPPPRAPTRAALAAWAGLFAAACGGAADGQAVPEGTSGGEGGAVPDGSSGGEGGAEAWCAGICGSHHDAECSGDPEEPCEVPPYGAPPIDETIV